MRACVVTCTLAAASIAGRALAGDGPAAGMRAYVDPGTGTLTDRPSGPPTQGLPAPSRSAIGLSEVPAPGGGQMIDLQGRFQSPLVATVGPDGTVRLRHEDRP